LLQKLHLIPDGPPLLSRATHERPNLLALSRQRNRRFVGANGTIFARRFRHEIRRRRGVDGANSISSRTTNPRNFSAPSVNKLRQPALQGAPRNIVVQRNQQCIDTRAVARSCDSVSDFVKLGLRDVFWHEKIDLFGAQTNYRAK
jgi:hypothetical protein